MPWRADFSRNLADKSPLGGKNIKIDAEGVGVSG